MPAPPPDLTAASGAMVMDGGTSRRALTTAMLDLASRGLICVPRGEGMLGLRPQGRHRRRPGQGRRDRGGAAGAERAPPDRPGRGGRAQEAPLARRRRGDGYITPDDLPKFGHVRRRFRQGARAARRRAAAGSRRSRARSRCAGPAEGRRWRSSPGSSPSSSGCEHPDLRPRPDRRRRRSPAGSSSCSSPGACRRSRCPAR